MSEDSDRNPDFARQSLHFLLEHGEQTFELAPGRLSIGRSSSCHVVLDDAMVSRRHAQLIVRADAVSIQDLGSVNGVYLNSQRVNGVELLRAGDHIQIGAQELIVRALPLEQLADSPSGPETLQKLAVAASNPPSQRTVPENETTFSAHTLDLLGGVAEKVLALGRGEEAERMLAVTLANLLALVHARGDAAAPSQVIEQAAWYAVRLAEETGNGQWVDFAVDLYSPLERPLPARVVDHLYQVLRTASAINLTGLREYLNVLRARQASFGPSERFLVQRLEGLERIAALR